MFNDLKPDPVCLCDTVVVMETAIFPAEKMRIEITRSRLYWYFHIKVTRLFILCCYVVIIYLYKSAWNLSKSTPLWHQTKRGNTVTRQKTPGVAINATLFTYTEATYTFLSTWFSCSSVFVSLQDLIQEPAQEPPQEPAPAAAGRLNLRYFMQFTASN